MFDRHAAIFLGLLCWLAASSTNANVPRPRGVPLSKASLYQPRNGNDKTWVCLDGTKTIKFLQINDDFCDCPDGSDEPGTSACGQGMFHCANVGHRPNDIPSSRVNDGICDCCDASDEYAANAGECGNTCQALGYAEQEQRKSEAELHKRGATKRSEMIARGRQMRAEREVRRAELERRRHDQEVIRAEKDELKRVAETAESEALEVYKEQQREIDAAAAQASKSEEVGTAQTMQMEAEASFVRYDTNKDGFVEVTELQVDISLDRDRNGVVTVEEAKYFLDERDRIDLDAFVQLSWPRLKTAQMLAQGIFKPPVITGDHEEEGTLQEQLEQPLAENEQKNEDNSEHAEDFDQEEEEDGYEDDEADVGVGSVTHEEGEVTPTPEYDPETQRLVDLANDARNAHSEVEREIRDIDNEIKEIDDQTAKDYGLHEEFATMDGECYSFEDREYVYTLCPFDRASQKQRSGGSETTLGRWDQWLGDGDNKFSKQKYSNGASCWNGPQRSVLVQLKCALDHRITAVSEPNRCEYFFEFETPAACDDLTNADADERQHDEL